MDSIVGTIAAILVPLYFIYVSKDYRWLFAISVGMNLVAIAGFAFFLDESPLYLYNKGKITEADNIVSKITKLNNSYRRKDHSLISKEQSEQLIEYQESP